MPVKVSILRNNRRLQELRQAFVNPTRCEHPPWRALRLAGPTADAPSRFGECSTDSDFIRDSCHNRRCRRCSPQCGVVWFGLGRARGTKVLDGSKRWTDKVSRTPDSGSEDKFKNRRRIEMESFISLSVRPARTESRLSFQEHSVAPLSHTFRCVARFAQCLGAIVLLASTSLADVRGPYSFGRNSGANLILAGIFLSLSIAAAGIWFVWYRRRGGSRLKGWIFAVIIAIGILVLIGIATTFAATH
jgi:hypothetical protein